MSTVSDVLRKRALVKNRELAKASAEVKAEQASLKLASKEETDNTSFGAGCTTDLQSSCSDDDSEGGTRILIYSHSLPPWVDGVSTRFKAHCRMLKEEGHHVSLVTIEENLDPQVRATAEDVTFVNSTHLYWYPAKRFPDLTLSNLALIWGACVRSQAQVMHVTMCPSLPLFFMCARALNIPLVVSVHTDSVTLLEKCGQPWWVVKACKALEPVATWFADATYTVSPSYSSILLQRGIKCLDVTWGGYANPLVFHPGRAGEGDWRNTLSFGHPEEFILITAGRVSPEKDIGFLVELVKRCRADGHKVRLAIIGDGPAAHEFTHLHGDEDDVGVWFVPGFLKQQELAQVYASVDVVASASTFETFGYTALEAMACGTPFLGPRAQGFRDVVSHGKGGYLFDAKDQKSASHYLELLVHEKAELFPPERVLAATADFTAKNCLHRTLQAYQLTKAKREAASSRFGCSRASNGHNPVNRAVMQALRSLPALLMVVFMALNWALLHAPLAAQAFASWVEKGAVKVTRRAGALWDRRMTYTNLTRNRVLVGAQITK